jgi:hypothetical protein
MAWKKGDDEIVEQFKPKTELVDDEPVVRSSSDSGELTFDFDEQEDVGQKKEIFTVYGSKNSGKTSTSYGIPHANDKVLVLSFDKKSTRPKDAKYITGANLTIHVIDAIKFLDKSDDKKYLDSAVLTHKFIISMLNQAKEKFAPDWVMFDGTEVMNGLMELVMRSHNNLKPYQGIANRSLWRERRQYLDDLHMKAVEVASKGVIYTMYSTKDDIVEEGNTIKKTDVPKWIGNIMEETDMVINTYVKSENGKNVFYAKIEGSKLPDSYPDEVYNVTNKRLRDLVGKSN